MVKMFIFALTLIGSLVMHAQVDKLAVVTNGMDSDKCILTVDTDETGALQNLHVTEDKSSHGSYPLADVQKGIVLVERSNRDIVLLSGADLDATAGGKVIISYLYNALTKRHKHKQLELFQQDGKWVMADEQHKIVKSIHFTTKKVLGKVVGLDEMIIK